MHPLLPVTVQVPYCLMIYIPIIVWQSTILLLPVPIIVWQSICCSLLSDSLQAPYCMLVYKDQYCLTDYKSLITCESICQLLSDSL